MAQAPTALQSPPAPDDKRIRFPKTPGDIDLLQPGDVVQSWDPWFVWDEFCESNATREKWRQMGDPLCDAALEAMFSSSSSSMNGVDLLEELVKQSEGISDPENPICSFLHSVSQMPPEGISATPEEIERAQSYFATHSMAITTAMMHFSLAGSFASPRISRVIRSLSYLVPAKGAATFPNEESQTHAVNRLLETLQFVIDVMGGSLPPPKEPGSVEKIDHAAWTGVSCLKPVTGEGWKSSVRVRMLHGVARRRVLQRAKREKAEADGTSSNAHVGRYYQPSIDGVPLNQEDMAFTLASFAFMPLYCLPLFGHTVPLADADATIACWRHIGFYLGIPNDILLKHFANWRRAEIYGATCLQMVHLELAETAAAAAELGVDPPMAPTVPILSALSGPKSVYRTPMRVRVALCRLLLGDKVSDILHLPQTTATTRIRLRWSLFSIAFPIHFGRLYAQFFPYRGRKWESDRRRVTLEALSRMTRARMGFRRTVFRPRDVSGQLDESVQKAESTQRDTADSERFRRDLKNLMREMKVVLIVLLVGALWILYSIVYWFR